MDGWNRPEKINVYLHEDSYSSLGKNALEVQCVYKTVLYECVAVCVYVCYIDGCISKMEINKCLIRYENAKW